jgi:hypothetical protein
MAATTPLAGAAVPAARVGAASRAAVADGVLAVRDTQPADQGTLYGGANHTGWPGAPGGADRRVRPLTPLHIGAHLASEAALDRIRTPVPGTGVLLGHDRDHLPVSVRLFRPEPTRATLVGGMWAARVAVFRALALGARVVVFTTAPEAWQRFGGWATGRADRVAVMPAERPVTVAASPRLPALLVYDVGLLGAANRPALGPWQTQLTVLRQLTAYGFPAVQESNLVAVQRLAAEEAVAAGSVLRLGRDTTALLQVLRDDMLALLGGGADRYVWLAPTTVEQHQFGPPHR